MLKRKTVFVVGAGASFEFGLPVGPDLAKKISKKVSLQFDRFNRQSGPGDSDLFESIRLSGKAHEYARAALVIRDGIILASSIDDFLHVHRHDQFIVDYGKATIAKCILEAEADCKLKLYQEQRSEGLVPAVSLSSCEDTWIVKLMRLLFRGTSKVNCARVLANCSFVIFNYDRCIEHFFLHALSKAYDIGLDESAEIVAKATFIHPYGAVGDLNPTDPPLGVAFGQKHTDWFKLGKNSIKTYTETVDDKEIKKVVDEAKTVVFLGFAYHDQNMSLLAEGETFGAKTFIGTTYGMSENDVRVVKGQISSWQDVAYQKSAERRMFFEDTTASKLLISYQKSL